MLTPFRWHKGAFGPVTPDQLVPFQCRISGPLVPLPTAHASYGDTALTPLRKPGVLVTGWARWRLRRGGQCRGQHRGCPPQAGPAATPGGRSSGRYAA